MSARDWTTLAFRLTGIYVILMALIEVPRALYALEGSDGLSHYGGESITLESVIMAICTTVLPMVIGAMLLSRTDWFVDKAFASVLKGRGERVGERGSVETAAGENDMTDDDAEWVTDFSDIRRDDLQTIAFALMGVWILSTALPDALAYLFEFMVESSDNHQMSFLDRFVTRDGFGPVYSAGRFGLGLWLFLSSHRIATFWSRNQSRPELVE